LNIDKELSTKAKEMIRMFKCSGQVAFQRNGEIERIEDAIMNNK